MMKAMARRCLANVLYICHASLRTPDSGFMAVMVQRKTPPLGGSEAAGFMRSAGPAAAAGRGRQARSPCAATRPPGHLGPPRAARPPKGGSGSVPVVTQADGDVAAVAGTYRFFGRLEARGRSAVYETLAESVADDTALLTFIASLPPKKRQPNLLFAAARYLLGAPPDIGSLRELASQSRAELTQVILARRTQTNEPARCAVLLPVLAQLPQPLALIEAGASAGLNLLADRYSYDYAGHRLPGLDPDAPVLRCEPRGPVPLPARIPAISWRAGLDLNPLDVTREDDARWLACLVWPGEGDRAQRLEAAIASARRDPPAVHRGDMLTDLPSLAAQAPDRK